MKCAIVVIYSELNALLQNLYIYEIADICDLPYLEKYRKDKVLTIALQFFRGELDKNKWKKEHGYFDEEDDYELEEEICNTRCSSFLHSSTTSIR